MNAGGAKRPISAAQRAAIALLLDGATREATADACGVSSRQVRRWHETEAFRAELEAASKARLNAAIGRLRALTVRAVETLARALDDQATATAVRAAVSILEIANAVALEELERRVEAIERREGRA